jgi:hypothetical protein
MSGLFILSMLGASVMPKFFMPQVSGPVMIQLGWPAKYTVLIGIIELAGTLLYAFSRTAVLGAVILMGLLGGAMATQLRIDNPLFSHTLFSLYLGLLCGAGCGCAIRSYGRFSRSEDRNLPPLNGLTWSVGKTTSQTPKLMENDHVEPRYLPMVRPRRSQQGGRILCRYVS